MRERPWDDLLIFSRIRRQAAEIEAWVSKNHDTDIRCKLSVIFHISRAESLTRQFQPTIVI